MTEWLVSYAASGQTSGRIGNRSPVAGHIVFPRRRLTADSVPVYRDLLGMPQAEVDELVAGGVLS